jgi:hypothetical protein
MDIEAKIRKLESDIKMKRHYLTIEISPATSDMIFKSTLREQIRNMEQEITLLQQMLDSKES